nr:hypothetical protein [Tanacetum cinerariifolium]
METLADLNCTTNEGRSSNVSECSSLSSTSDYDEFTRSNSGIGRSQNWKKLMKKLVQGSKKSFYGSSKPMVYRDGATMQVETAAVHCNNRSGFCYCGFEPFPPKTINPITPPLLLNDTTNSHLVNSLTQPHSKIPTLAILRPLTSSKNRTRKLNGVDQVWNEAKAIEGQNEALFSHTEQAQWADSNSCVTRM